MAQKIQALRAVCDSVELSLAQTLSGVPCGRNEAQIVVQSAADLAFSLVALDAYVREARVKRGASVSPDLFHRAKAFLDDHRGQTNGTITRTLVREVVASMKNGESRAEVKSATDKLIGIFCP